MNFDSDAHLSLDSRKMRRVFEEAPDEEVRGRQRNRDLVDEYAQGFKRMKNMGLDENMWQE